MSTPNVALQMHDSELFERFQKNVHILENTADKRTKAQQRKLALHVRV